MSLWSFAGQAPRVARGAFIAPTASVIGAVELGEDASIWFGSVLRGDVGPISIGRRTNVQDLTMVHLTGGVSETRIGDDVTIGHAVILHGCTVGDRCLIGMGSLLLDNVTVGAESLIGAGSLLTPGMVIPPRSFALGRPARVLRAISEQEVIAAVERAQHYVELARTHTGSLAAQPPPTK